MCIWDANNSRKPVRNFNAGFEKVFATSQNEQFLSVCGVASRVDIYDLKTLRLFKSLPCIVNNSADAVLTYHAKFCGAHLITADYDGRLLIYDSTTFQLLHKQEAY